MHQCALGLLSNSLRCGRPLLIDAPAVRTPTGAHRLPGAGGAGGPPAPPVAERISDAIHQPPPGRGGPPSDSATGARTPAPLPLPEPEPLPLIPHPPAPEPRPPAPILKRTPYRAPVLAAAERISHTRQETRARPICLLKTPGPRSSAFLDLFTPSEVRGVRPLCGGIAPGVDLRMGRLLRATQPRSRQRAHRRFAAYRPTVRKWRRLSRWGTPASSRNYLLGVAARAAT
jgi:hypothetical protein